MSTQETFEARPETRYELPPMWSWQEFLDRATAPATTEHGRARRPDPTWGDATWDESVHLATDGWTAELPDIEVSIAELRTRSRQIQTTVLVPHWDVTGSEVDIGAYLAGEPECMIDAVPQPVTTHGRVVTFFVPATYAHTVPHHVILNRGLALSALCSSIIMAGHSVEVWSGYGGHIEDSRVSAVARVVSPAEPLDMGRLIFALSHPAMLRRLWFGVWDSAPEALSRALLRNNYGKPPLTSFRDDLPDSIEDPYILPFLHHDDDQWETLDSALAWCQEIFVDLGLLHE